MNFRSLKRFSLLIVSIAFSTVFFGCSKGTHLGPESAQYLATASQDACGYLQNDFGQRVSWKDKLPIEFYVSKTIPTEFHEDISAAAEKWNYSAGKPVVKINFSDLEGAQFSTDDTKNVIYGFTDWDEDKSTQQALTIVKYRVNQITSADIKINFQHFIYYKTEAKEKTQIHFASLILHEIGHALGLKHAAPRPTVMWPTLASDYVRMQLSTSDRQSVGCEY